MKRVVWIIGLLVLAALFGTSSVALASGKASGVYITPKFTYGYLSGYDVKVERKEGYSSAWGSGEYSWDEKFSMKSGHSFGGAIAAGYDFHRSLGAPVRLEFEYALFSDMKKKHHDIDSYGDPVTSKLNIGIQTLFVNAYYDFRNSSAFTPYLGFGLGMAFVGAKGEFQDVDYPQYDYSLKKKSSANFAWNLNAGVAYAFTDSISLDFGYRFASIGKGKTKDTVIYEYESAYYSSFSREQWKTKDLYMHQLMLGLRFAF